MSFPSVLKYVNNSPPAMYSMRKNKYLAFWENPLSPTYINTNEMINFITYEEWMVDVCENGIFRNNVIYLSKLYDISLL